MGLAKPTKL